MIDVEYVISDVGRRNLFADYFGDLHALQEDLRVVESTYVLITPKARQFYFNQPRLTGWATPEVKRGARRRTHLHPAGAPGAQGAQRARHARFYRGGRLRSRLDIQGLGGGRRLVSGIDCRTSCKRTTTSARRSRRRCAGRTTRWTAFAASTTGGAEDPLRRARVRPARLQAISRVPGFARKFGDCKDKAALLWSCCGRSGSNRRSVLARTRRGGDIDPFRRRSRRSNHALVYVPKYDLYLDGTAEFSGAPRIAGAGPGHARAAGSDPRSGGQGHLARTPIAPAARTASNAGRRCTLAADGSATVALTNVVSGEVAHEWREHYQTPGERERPPREGGERGASGEPRREVHFVVDGFGRPRQGRGPAGGAGLGAPARRQPGDARARARR